MVQLLSSEGLGGIQTHIKVTHVPQEGTRSSPSDPTARNDGYWSVHTMRPASFAALRVAVTISGPPAALAALQSAVVHVYYSALGPHGLELGKGKASGSQQVVLPLSFPSPLPAEAAAAGWTKQCNGAEVLPIRTHLLSHLDDPVSIISHYVKPVARPGDVVAIAESALAVMQGRYRHPRVVRMGVTARLLCRLFNPLGSLASATGMQVLRTFRRAGLSQFLDANRKLRKFRAAHNHPGLR